MLVKIAVVDVRSAELNQCLMVLFNERDCPLKLLYQIISVFLPILFHTVLYKCTVYEVQLQVINSI